MGQGIGKEPPGERLHAQPRRARPRIQAAQEGWSRCYYGPEGCNEWHGSTDARRCSGWHTAAAPKRDASRVELRVGGTAGAARPGRRCGWLQPAADARRWQDYCRGVVHSHPRSPPSNHPSRWGECGSGARVRLGARVGCYQVGRDDGCYQVGRDGGCYQVGRDGGCYQVGRDDGVEEGHEGLLGAKEHAVADVDH
eukprot:2181549-Prymnesium_polylepis.1